MNGSVAKITLASGIDSLSLVLLRSAGAAVLLFGLVLVTDRSRLKVHRREIPNLLLYGTVGIAMVQWLYFVALSRMPVGIAILLEFTGPVLVALWVHFVQHQRLGRSLWVALAFALSGIALISQFWAGFQFNVVGVLAAMGAAVSLATAYIAGKNVVTSRDTVSTAFWAFVIAAVFWSIAKPWWTVPWSDYNTAVPLPGFDDVSVNAWWLVLWIVVLGTVVPFLFVVGALRRLPATEAGVIGMIEPVMAGVVAWIWLDEALAVVQVVGSALVIMGIVVAQRATQASPVRAANDPTG